jgi:hypothetical protein
VFIAKKNLPKFAAKLVGFLHLAPAEIAQSHDLSAHEYKFCFEFSYQFVAFSMDFEAADALRQYLLLSQKFLIGLF